jgi:hypothetical protein
MTLAQKYNAKVPISKPKYDDLKHLCSVGAIPTLYHTIYQDLPQVEQTNETCQCSDEED